MSRLRPSGWLAVAGVSGVFSVAILFPVFAQGRSVDRIGCFGKLREISVAISWYAADHDDRLPLRDAWMDEIEDRLPRKGALRCPQGPPGGFGYAFNGALNGTSQSQLDDLPLMPLVYDSVNPVRNASDRVTSLPIPGRHHGENHIAYAFGHVRPVKP